jgi:hypothetical protein
MTPFLLGFRKRVVLSLGRSVDAQIARRPKMNDATAITRKTKKQILASVAKSPAKPPNPSTAATIAIRKNVMAQLSIGVPFRYFDPAPPGSPSWVFSPWRRRYRDEPVSSNRCAMRVGASSAHGSGSTTVRHAPELFEMPGITGDATSNAIAR